MTLPLIAALDRAEAAERKRILGIVRKRKKRKADVEAVGAFVAERGGLAHARAAMEALAADAAEALRSFPPSEARDALVGLAAYTVARKK